MEEKLRERKQMEMKIASDALKEAGVEVMNNGNAECVFFHCLPISYLQILEACKQLSDNLHFTAHK